MAGKYAKPLKAGLFQRKPREREISTGHREGGKYQPKYGAKKGKSSVSAEIGHLQIPTDKEKTQIGQQYHSQNQSAAGFQRQLADKRITKRRAELEKKLSKKGSTHFTVVKTQYKPKSALNGHVVVNKKKIFKTSATNRPGIKRAWIVIGAVIVVAMLVFGLWNLIAYITDPYNIRPIPGQDPNAVNGTLVENAEEQVEPSFYRIVINMIPKMQVGSRTCNLNIENVLGNAYTVKVNITDEQGALLYASGYIQPGQRVMDVQLEKELSEGEHTVTATYFLFEKDTLAESGSTGTSITITVLP